MTRIEEATRAFFSFAEVLGDRHRSYNQWHTYDHKPENLALPGVLTGDRWVRSPECRDASPVDTDPDLSAAHYVAMYWFAEPAEQSIAEWVALGTSTHESGRRPELDWTRRRHLGFFRPFDHWATPSVLVSPGAVPFRPHRGMILDVVDVLDTTAPVCSAFPGAVDVAGVAGGCSFVSRGEQASERRLSLLWCHDDPLAVVGRLPAPESGATSHTVLRTPLLTVSPDPDTWTWFD